MRLARNVPRARTPRIPRTLALGLGLGGALLWAAPASAEWTVNVGYHNPVDSTWGLNLQYLGSQWAFEAGVGWVDVRENKTTDDQGKTKTKSATLDLAGDVDVKYFLGSGKVRLYLQGGFGVGIGATAGSDGGAGAGTGGGFGGIGLMLGGPSFYAYGAYNLDSARDGFVQAGLGTSL